MKLYELTASDLSQLLQKKEVSSVDILESFLERIEQVEPYIRAFITHTPAMALQTARQVDTRRLRKEKLHPLAGVPIALKDNICTMGLRTTCASRILENFIPPFDATVVALINAIGMPLLGKTNMDEFAMGSSTENSAFYTTRNPWDLNRVPGGSSGGSAAAVAACMTPLALGSDTGGSIRQPASLCGLTGLRPTYGRVSRYGLIPFASSLDQIGTLSVTAKDSALLLGAIAGHDPLDSTSLSEPVPDYLNELAVGFDQLRVGIIEQNIEPGFDPEVIAAVMHSVKLLEEQGARIDRFSFPLRDYGLSAYCLLAPSEASSNLSRYDGVRYGFCHDADDIEAMFRQTRGKGFGSEVKRRVMIGTYALSADNYQSCYLKAMKVRTLICRDFETAFSKYDLLIGATTPTAAFKIGEKSDDPLKMYYSDICNVADALAGIPSLTVMSGVNRAGLPMGVQLTAPSLDEGLLLKAAHVLEQGRKQFPSRPRVNLSSEAGCFDEV